MQEKLQPPNHDSQDAQTDSQAEQVAGPDKQRQDTAEEEQQQAKVEGEQRQAKVAAKKAKKQRQKATRQQAQGLTPPSSEPDSSAPQSPSAQSSISQTSDAQLRQLKSPMDHTEAQDSGSQSLQAEAHTSDSQHRSNADNAMLDLFRCPITKVSHAARTRVPIGNTLSLTVS